ncbi:MAG: bifunctional chorismate mutase/prephenate dehydrogenase [Balneolales bacterium]
MKSLNKHRIRIDQIDTQILELLRERNDVVKDVRDTKIQNKLPIFVAGRESEKVASFREKAKAVDLDPDWAEDFLRMIMSASRASQSNAEFPRATIEPKTFLFIGGKGGMGKLYARIAKSSGHEVRILDKEDWDKIDDLTNKVDVVVITVPIKITKDVISKIAPYLEEQTILADFTSNKAQILDCMMDTHHGPVVGLHPMHGPDVNNLSKQLMMVCPGRKKEDYDWLIQQFGLWGLRVKQVDPESHDHAMNLIQGLRHFVALLHGSFMKQFDLKPGEITDFSSPIYRAELMMTGRIFAQDAELYADIVFANFERRTLLIEFFEHHQKLVELVKQGDRQGFIDEFEAISVFFGDFAEQALEESSYLINRLADRFAE